MMAMRLQNMSNMKRVAEELQVGRGDPVYQAHAYLTKVPVPAITPFIEKYSRAGEVVVDPFAGSGMTGIASAILGRSARLFDISVLGRHIGRNYLNLVDPATLEKYAGEVVAHTQASIGDLYAVQCFSCGRKATLGKTVWSARVACRSCGTSNNYYRALEAADWQKAVMKCRECGKRISSRGLRVGEEAVFDSIVCACSKRQVEQVHTEVRCLGLEGISYPKVEITSDREMYKVQALGKSGLTSIAAFYSPRNLTVLASLRNEIQSIEDLAVKEKLMFAFTAILARSSKRYQWSHQGPLNAANAYYYISPVFYEWNVYDLFSRKIKAILKADDKIRTSWGMKSSDESPVDPDVVYEIGSAERIPLANESVDYIFTDPPFGSNLFYADMALFHEAWLGNFTDHTREAVIDRSDTGPRDATRYEDLLVRSLRECRRILKPGRKLSMIFGNSSGRVWALLQRAIHQANMRIIPEDLVVLNKGQRSVKGLASGFQHVATLDLVITMEPAVDSPAPLQHVENFRIAELTRNLARTGNATTPSHLYLELLRTAIRENWMLEDLDLRTVTACLANEGWSIESKTGMLRKCDPIIIDGPGDISLSG
jgi:16S rRNA G966 N2-methylase RsmD